MIDIKIEPATPEHAEKLSEIYLASLKESLERVGAFNPIKLKSQFIDNYSQFNFEKIVTGNKTIGFFSIKEMEDHLWLVHLYIDIPHQGKGIGTIILDRVKRLSKEKNLPIRLTAIKNSKSNSFYQKHGFIKINDDDSNIDYKYEPSC
ncbi:GNAT family N-acetyltransferase [Spartinivicinus ruber]|uniref:GNAT family N-acetyltransferase n=1 Tax=Spartinivicinus ruber TaxID=2683272 RepID=UPI0013D6901E|nr:GNAT family N-acetyltransferase [Spartinivicinus ruber]